MKLIIILSLLLVAPLTVWGDVYINEIMYDLDGTDSGREWVEVYNSGTEDIDLSLFRLFENGVNHKISIYDPTESGKTSILSGGEYGIVADKPEKFLNDHNYSGLLFDSVFSLSNVGEVIALVDDTDNIIHSVAYSPGWGAKGTGNTLQLDGELWIPAIPTIGYVNSTEPVLEGEEGGDDSGGTETSSDDQSTHSSQTSLTTYTEKVDLKIGLGRVRYGLINTPIVFKVLNNSGEESGKHTWSFGDGESDRGEVVEHYYHAKGDYNIVLNSEYDNKDAVSRSKVIIREPKIELSLINRGKDVDILLINRGETEVNLGRFFLKFKYDNHRQRFIFPKDTIIDSKSEIYLPYEVTNFSILSNSPMSVSLYYPNNKEMMTIDSIFVDGNELIKILTPFVEDYMMIKLKEVLQNLHKYTT